MKDKVKIGFIPLTDSAPLVVAKEEGFFEQFDLDVSLIREVSWSNIRDKLVFSELDAAHMLAPLLIASSFGLGSVKKPLVTAYSFGLNGNAVSVSNEVFAELIAIEPDLVLKPEKSASALKQVALSRKKQGKGLLRFAVVFPYSMHNYLLRHWFSTANILVGEDVEIVVVPPSSVVQALDEGLIDGYCVGEPWNTHAVKKQVGVTVITGYEIWNNAPEKVLGVRAAWAEENVSIHKRLIKALYLASQWIDDASNYQKLVKYLSLEQYVGAPEESIQNTYKGEVCNPINSTCRSVPNFSLPFRYQANFPWQSHAEWIVCQMQSLGQLPTELNAKEIAKSVYWTDLYRDVISSLGVSLPSVNVKEEGVHSEIWYLDDVELGSDALI
ncbi:CmpA/NrtA family ABC transporter substrate-binding protein [Thiomicrorhabdus sp. Kp2]|uniref:CmpA/NrtA family ABC transporter substrate-binding protein n=1 Tax=Thiomicrorhabdus sp. Kp2 TaxID=1123518 RepID=UPI0003F9F498|nr:CmpA/NrtA family ABC transporter substrate-binding protein [Thiomicrorhabdus sp. Kp2]